MTEDKNGFLQKLEVPKGRVDVVLDTDAHAEIDDQFAIAYMLASKEKLDPKAIYAAPYSHKGSIPPWEAMELSYGEIKKVQSLMGEDIPTFRGSEHYLPDEHTPVVSAAALDLAKRVDSYSSESPLYVVAIGAITNVASAILLNPKMTENAVVVWLGGHAHHYARVEEYNLRQDVAAARVVFSSGIPLVQLPCMGVVSSFAASRPELEGWFIGKSAIADYLSKITIDYIEKHAHGPACEKVIWDVTAVAWLLNDGERFLESRLIEAPLPLEGGGYESVPGNHMMRYVYHVKRDALMNDLIEKLTKSQHPKNG